MTSDTSARPDGLSAIKQRLEKALLRVGDDDNGYCDIELHSSEVRALLAALDQQTKELRKCQETNGENEDLIARLQMRVAGSEAEVAAFKKAGHKP